MRRLCFLLFLGLLPCLPANAQRLNDTAQTTCYDVSTSTGTVAPATPDPELAGYNEQDCTRGAAAADALGRMVKVGGSTAPGRDYTKIAGDGSELPASATLGSGPSDWACTRDNITGLIWEVKVNDSANLRHFGHTYTWYDPNPQINGGNAGSIGTGTSCNSTLANCNTTAYRNAVNALTGSSRLCGATDWRLPSSFELRSLTHMGVTNPAIDATWFPHTALDFYWTGTTRASNVSAVLAMLFINGGSNFPPKTNSHAIRLVRGGR
ncbi:MAG: DUF1566 domain-containing protein [Xanthomonadales bacterium]|jgi:hypothetical protein|nr:DUF1566 domain-containing protein [Xanthomonadales bacterium]